MSMEVEEVRELFDKFIKDKWTHQCLKTEQLQLLRNVLNRKKVTYGILPTGFGKSDCYALPPLLLDQIDPENAPHVALVISPLRSLMLDQVGRWKTAGIKCSAILQRKEIEADEVQSILKAEQSLVFASPETIMAEPWRSMLHSDEWVKHLVLVCCDEAHCIHDWGLDFRPSYQKITELRAVADVPWLFLTATCTSQMYESINKVIGNPKDPSIVALLPDRPNIYLQFVARPQTYHKELRPVVQQLQDCNIQTPKTIIYCCSTEDVCDIFEFFYSQLGDHIFIPGRDRQAFGSMLVLEYHRGIGKSMEQNIVDEFVKPESSVRVLISTVAFGMGVEISDITNIIHWGLSSTIPAYWQEVGRSGRNGKQANATLYPVKVDQRYSSKEFCDLVSELRKEGARCMRKAVLEHFVLPDSNKDILKTLESRSACELDCEDCECDCCKCCSICRRSCPCQVK